MGELKRVSDRYIGANVWVRGETYKTESEVADLCQPKWNENKRYLLLGRKAMTNLDSILKSRDTTLSTNSVQSKLWFYQQSCMDVGVGP